MRWGLGEEEKKWQGRRCPALAFLADTGIPVGHIGDDEGRSCGRPSLSGGCGVTACVAQGGRCGGEPSISCM